MNFITTLLKAIPGIAWISQRIDRALQKRKFKKELKDLEEKTLFDLDLERARRSGKLRNK